MKIRPVINGPRAFTLVEVMVAIFILAIIVAAMYSTWTAIVRGAAVGRKAAADVQRSRMAMATIEEALSSARSFGADIQHYSFEAENGSKAYLSFVAKVAASFPRSGRFEPFDVRRITFSVEPAADNAGELVLRQTPLLMEMDVDEEEHPIVLARDVKSFSMEFWDTRSGEWMDEWTQTNQLPPMVKVSLQFSDSGQNTRVRQELSRLVALPSVTVPSGWQAPGARGGGGLQTIRPGENPVPGGNPLPGPGPIP